LVENVPAKNIRLRPTESPLPLSTQPVSVPAAGSRTKEPFLSTVSKTRLPLSAGKVNRTTAP